jgi:hypothetical protein
MDHTQTDDGWTSRKQQAALRIADLFATILKQFHDNSQRKGQRNPDGGQSGIRFPEGSH